MQTLSELQEKHKLPSGVVDALSGIGVKEPTAVQMQVWPLLCGGRDVIVISPTGSGKTLAFAVPIVLALSGRQENKPGVQALSLAPTRELAQQTARVFTMLCSNSQLRAKLLTKASAAGENFKAVRPLSPF